MGGKALADKLESLTVQSEMDLKLPGDGGLRLSHFNPGFAGGSGRGLVVADRPVLPNHSKFKRFRIAALSGTMCKTDRSPEKSGN